MGFINKRRAVLGIVHQVDAEWFRNTLDTIKGSPLRKADGGQPLALKPHNNEHQFRYLPQLK
jgi:hypothetical protein